MIGVVEFARFFFFFFLFFLAISWEILRFNEFSLPLWLKVRVRKRGSAKTPFSCFLMVVMCQWLQVFGNDILFSLLLFGFRELFSGKSGKVQRLHVVKPK